MAVAKLLRNVNLFVDGRGYAGRIEEFDPPKLTIKTEEFRAGGMDMPLEYDMGMEKLECKFTLANADRDVLKLFGLTAGSGTAVTLRGSQKGRTGPSEPVVHQIRGLVKEVDWGTWKPGEKAPCSLMVAADYYKFELDGETIHEIDPENNKRIIDGVDQLEEMRRDLGL